MTLRQLFKRKYAIKILIILIIVPIGFYTKFYSGPLQKWVSYSLGDFWYEIFWCLVISLFFPNLKSSRIAIIVFFRYRYSRIHTIMAFTHFRKDKRNFYRANSNRKLLYLERFYILCRRMLSWIFYLRSH